MKEKFFNTPDELKLVYEKLDKNPFNDEEEYIILLNENHKHTFNHVYMDDMKYAVIIRKDGERRYNEFFNDLNQLIFYLKWKEPDDEYFKRKA